MSDNWYLIITVLMAIVFLFLTLSGLIAMRHAPSRHELEVERVARNRLRRQKFEAEVQMKMMELQAEKQERDTPEEVEKW